MKKLFYLLLLPLMMMSTACDKEDDADYDYTDPGYVMPDYRGKKIGLVLSGGGAKGAAQIGALRVMEQNGIKVDYISGTSIGSMLGALYAAGYTSDELEDFFSNLDEEEAKSSKKVREILSKLLQDKGVTTFQDLKIPFRCVVSDAKNLKEVVLSEGNVLDAIMASSAIPYVYDNVTIDGNLYVDGGFYNNLPVDVALDMGAEFTIVVDLRQDGEGFFPKKFNFLIEAITTSPELAHSFFGDATDVVTEYYNSRPDADKYEQNVNKSDIYIHPRLTNYDALSFGKSNCKNMIEIGEKAANAKIQTLAK